MRHLKAFEDFLKEGIARKISPDKERSKNLILESERKLKAFNESVEKIGIKDENANDYVEHCYDIIMFLVRAKLYHDGYSAGGQGAHEAEVAFARNLGFSEGDVQFLDELRYFRNGILYYGRRLDAEYAKLVLEFMNKIYPKLRNLVKI